MVTFKLIGALLLFFPLFVFGSNTQGIKIKVIENNAISIKVDKADKSLVDLSIKDRYGSILFNEKLSEIELNKKQYRLEDFKVGKYTIQIEYDQLIQVQKLDFKHDKIEMLDEIETIFKPTINFNNEYVDLNLLSLDNSKVEVKIRDFNNNTIYSGKFFSCPTVAKRFNTALLEDGDYLFSVSMENNAIESNYTREFEIRDHQIRSIH